MSSLPGARHSTSTQLDYDNSGDVWFDQATLAHDLHGFQARAGSGTTTSSSQARQTSTGLRFERTSAEEPGQTDSDGDSQKKRSSAPLWSKVIRSPFKLVGLLLKSGAGNGPANFDSDGSEPVSRMANKRYFVTLICLSLFIVAFLLASFVISRNVGGLDDSESETSGQQMGLRAAGQPAEEYEVRTIHLVDLTECDKTFAYTKWRLSVRVPKLMASYKQKPQFLAHQSMVAQSSNQVSKRTSPASELSQTSKPTSEPGLSNRSNADNMNMDAGEHEDEGQDESRYVLTSTNEFVSRGQVEHRDDSSQQAPVSGRKDSLDSRSGRSARQLTPSTRDNEGRRLKEVMQLAGVDLDDPMRVAASEMHLSLSSVNSSVVDCFIVDTEKRYQQKMAIEDRHRQITSTRQIDFDKMMAIIQACRTLTWATLTGANSVADPLRGANGQSSLGERAWLAQASERSELDVIRPVNDSLILHEVIKPVESKNRTPPLASSDFVNSFLGAWLSPGSSASTPTAATGGDQLVSESQQRGQLTGAPRPVTNPAGRLVAAPVTVNPSAQPEDQATRGSYLNMGMSMVSGIVPNTLWCGLGDRAANYSELGAEFKVDSCCRAHDHCPIRLKPFAADYGLINWSMSTRSHCGCDLDFSDCLSTVNSTLSNVIKTLYFRFVGLQCIDIEGRQLVTPPVTVSSGAV